MPTPCALHVHSMQSMPTPCPLLAHSVCTPCTLRVDSVWTPCGLRVHSVPTPCPLRGGSTESVEPPRTPQGCVGECNVLEESRLFILLALLLVKEKAV